MVQGQGQLCVDPDPFHFLGRSPLVDEVYHPKEASWIQLLDPGGLAQPYLEVQNPQVLSQLRVLVRVELKAGHYISPIFTALEFQSPYSQWRLCHHCFSAS